MSVLPVKAFETRQILTGNDAGWLLSFYTEKRDAKGFRAIEKLSPILEIGRDDYYAQIDATLPGGLEGGNYSFVIEGLTDEHYRTLKQQARLVVKLFLYWRDTNASAAGYLKNIAGLTDFAGDVKGKDIPSALVAVLSVVSITRRAGSRLYETTIKCRERTFEILNEQRLCGKNAISANAEVAITELLKNRIKFNDFEMHEFTAHPVSKYVPSVKGAVSNGEQSFKPGSTGRDLLRQLGRRLEEKTGRRGRGLFLVRDGKLHIGVRPIPLPPIDGGTRDNSEGHKFLNADNGLIEVEPLAPLIRDPNSDALRDHDSPGSEIDEVAEMRRQFKATLKGRPDIKPGDVVVFDVDLYERGFVTVGLSGPEIVPKVSVNLYVSSVTHRLSRTSGFATTITGVEFRDDKDVWDGHTPRGKDAKVDKKAEKAGAQSSVGAAFEDLIESRLKERHFAEVAEVRGMVTKGGGDPPSQTIALRRGLVESDGDPRQARRLAVDRDEPDEAPGVPYTSPFAWGKCGLVLPRYPGTRVAAIHRQGLIDDPIEVGALWESGKGPNSQFGDWWLILPVGVTEPPDTIPESEIPKYHEGKVSQDLIDADGARVIEVGELTIRVLPQDKLDNAGVRPARAKHKEGGASIIVKPDGSVTIRAKTIEFDAGDGEINMKAKTVNVDVTDAMDIR